MTTLEQSIYVVKYCLDRYENIMNGKDQAHTIKFPISSSEPNAVILETLVREYFQCEYEGNGFVVNLLKPKMTVLGANERFAK
jgi:hypothetical protein